MIKTSKNLINYTIEQKKQIENDREAYYNSDEYRKKQIKILKKNLSDTDYVVCKIVEGEATVDEYSEVLEKRKDWRRQINELEEKINVYKENT